ncbi:DUF3152 domain-containing protein [Actinokineospora globicatena]|uniref:DUF3152 domain-containing protein n=1 Tax=Actinokineospora globicatena TaxID=103729 RepID=UPI0020A617FF|nr:DUF3152 domain-containing protein [Actinokineospora globicatena]MCP2300393.1 Protein of unknown function (DUF3152) [Actinokineospora globicatena]GLW80925.1 hypothetical protein Aglo01_54060 [Actinokineospora globicatena]GLW88118.1 hypothetical protein Aglo02_57570 [Actinokineospora globicatena]
MTQGEPDTATGSSRSAATPEAGERYRRSGRRTSAEPLAASWQPERPRKARKRGFLATYGWRVYAVPVLIAVTALVAVRTAGDKAESVASAPSEQATEQVNPVTEGGSGVPDVTERPPGPVDVNIPTAELPNGGAFTQTGKVTFHVVPGSGPKIGTGAKFFTYTVEVEDGIDPASYGGDDAFASLVDSTLADPRGWTGLGEISVQRVAADFPNPSFRISLTTPDTAHRGEMCGFSIKYESSCYRSSEKRVMINLARWSRGAVVFGGDMLTYRQYALNHEVGHAFRNNHVGCPQAGALAPVMMQQSFGVANDYVAQLNKAVGNPDPVKADGLVCKPNAWPNPQARPTP